mmetsp:Transcript_22326/g.21528  ORF Transcript_22326/g.21528 Transcript_22326/m.21528 type:complete len:89 (+) Transcript_22326:19-285(+)
MGCVNAKGRDPVSAAKTELISLDAGMCDNHEHPVKNTQHAERYAKNEAYGGGWSCNGCGSGFETHQESVSCVPCEFDLCKPCFSKHKI